MTRTDTSLLIFSNYFDVKWLAHSKYRCGSFDYAIANGGWLDHEFGISVWSFVVSEFHPPTFHPQMIRKNSFMTHPARSTDRDLRTRSVLLSQISVNCLLCSQMKFLMNVRRQRVQQQWTTYLSFSENECHCLKASGPGSPGLLRQWEMAPWLVYFTPKANSWLIKGLDTTPLRSSPYFAPRLFADSLAKLTWTGQNGFLPCPLDQALYVSYT